MSQCEGITKAGSRCKRQASPGQRFCSLHESSGSQEEAAQGAEAPEASENRDDWMHLFIGLAAAVVVLLVIRSFPKPPSW